MKKNLWTINRNNHFQYFLWKLILFSIFIFIFDSIIGSMLNYFYFSQESGDQSRTTYSIQKTTADIIILGSSRASHHYNPAIFENKLNLSAYNAGRDGNFIFYHFAVLNGVLNRYTPKIVILDLNRAELQEDHESYDRIATLLPYYKNHPEIRSIIEHKGAYENIKLISNIYPFNSLILTIAIGNLELNKRRNADYLGYLPINKTYDGPLKTETISTRPKLDSLKVEVYKSIIYECNKKGVKLIIICSPYFMQFSTEDISLLVAEEIAKQNGVEFYDFSDNQIFLNNKKLFADNAHLNDNGATILSNLVSDSIINSELYAKPAN